MANENTIQATGTFVVTKGFALITKLVAAQGELEFTRAAVGTGKPPEGYSPESMIGLNAYKMDAEIADYGVKDDMAYITVQISSDKVQEGFLATEVGVFANDPDEGEILYGYMDISTDPTYIYADGSANRSKFAEFTLYLLIGSVSHVTASITPGSIITKETFTAGNLEAVDNYGLVGETGEKATGQALLDKLADQVVNKLVTSDELTTKLLNYVEKSTFTDTLAAYILKTKIVNDFLATDPETVLSGPMGKQLKTLIDAANSSITQLNSELGKISPSFEQAGAYPLYFIVRTGKSYNLAILFGAIGLNYVDNTRFSGTVQFPITFGDTGAYSAVVTPIWIADRPITPYVQKDTGLMHIHALNTGDEASTTPRDVNYIILGRIPAS